jgi:hypothetical protein
MHLSHIRRTIAGLAVAALALAQAGPVFAAYSDVPAGAWFENAVNEFADAGYLDTTKTRFRPGDLALRAEFIKLVVELNGGILGTAPAVPSFDDVAVGAWYYGYMEEAGAEGWVKGDGNCYGTHPCSARPSSNVNRAEAAALINRAFGLTATGEAPRFVDNPTGQWYTSDIQTAADNCVLQGDDATRRVRPGDPMNRAEMVVMLQRVDQGLQYPNCGAEGEEEEAALDSATAVSATTVELAFTAVLDRKSAEDVSNYEVPGLKVTEAVMTGDETVMLTLGSPMAAGEQYTVSVSVGTADGGSIEDSVSFTGYSPLAVGEGSLEVSINANNPIGDTVPRGAIGVNFLSLDFTASCEDDVIVESLTVIHEGFGDEADIDGLYLGVDGARVARKRSIDAEDQTADIRFTQPLVVPACQTVTVDVLGDYISTATINSERNIVVELASDVFSNARAVTGAFPLRGATFETAAVTSGAVTISYRSVTPTDIDVGDEGAVIGKFELSVNSVEDQTLYTITLENEGSASDGDYVNIAIRRSDGTVLTNTVAQAVGDFITFTFDPPFTIIEGDQVTLDVVADIVGGAADTVQLEFDETSDLFAIGSLYGYGVNGQLYGSQVTRSGTPTTVTINAGELTLEIVGPVTEEYTRDADDVVLAKVKTVTGGEDVDVNRLYVMILGRTSTGGSLCHGGSSSYDNIREVLEDVEIRNVATGRTIDAVYVAESTIPTCGAAAESYAVYRFDDFILRGEENWEIRIDFIDNGSGNPPEDGNQFRVEICTEEVVTTGTQPTCDFSPNGLGADDDYNLNADGLTTGDRVTDIRPGSVLVGNFQEVAEAGLFITQKSIGASDTVVENAKGVTIMRFEAKAGEAEDIYMTQVVFGTKTTGVAQGGSGSLLNGLNYTLAVDQNSDGTYETIVESGQTSQSNQIVFDEFVGGGYTIPAEETALFEVRADISGSPVNDDLQIVFATGATNYIEAEEADDGSALTAPQTNTPGCSGRICVTTAQSKLFFVRSQGDLFVQRDSTPVRSRQLLGGTLGDPILRIELRAENEDIDVTDLIITAASPPTSLVGTTAPSSIEYLELYKAGENTRFAVATRANCRTDAFCADMESRQLVVPDGKRVDVLVRPRIKTDVGGAISAQTIAVYLGTGASATLTTTGTGGTSVVARGANSSNDISFNDFDTTAEGEIFVGRDTVGGNALISGNTNDVVLAKITSIANAHVADGTSVPSGTDKTIAKFRFTAADHANVDNGLNKAVLSGVIFNVTSNDINFGAGNFQIYNTDNATSKVSCRMINTAGVVLTTGSGTFLVDCRALEGSVVDSSIDAGGTLTLALEADIQNKDISTAATANLQVSLTKFSDRSATVYGGGAAQSHVNWKDDVGSAAGVSMFRWIEYDVTEVASTSYSD